MSALSAEAVIALRELELGVKMNTMHTVARELMAAGMAIDGWGVLEITEAGRRAVRTLRSFAVDDPNISNMGDMNEPKWTTPAVSHTLGEAELRRLRDMPVGSEIVTHRDTSAPRTPWSKERARQAAGVASGETGIWIEAQWLDAFIEAYEASDDR